MASKKNTEQVYEQAPDPRGRIRLDRPATPQEAQAQDEANRAAYEAERASRFRPR